MPGSSISTDRAAGRTWLDVRLTAWPVLAVALLALVVSVGSMLWHTDGYHIDLEVYRIGVGTWLAGGDMYGPLPPTISGLGLPFIYPVFAATLLVPFALLPWTAAWVLLFALSLASLGATLHVTARQLWPAGGTRGALAVASLALPLLLWVEPVLETIEFGQVNLILMGLVAVDCLAPRTRWPRGLLVGVAAAIKLTPAAFVLFFLLRRDYRAAVVTVVTATVATGIGFLVDAASSARYWFDGPASGISGSIFYTNQTIQAVLARAEVPTLVAKVVWMVAAVALLALIAPVVRRADPALALVTVAGFALLVSPTSWSHHWVWIAPALLVVVTRAVQLRSRGWAAAAVVLAAAFFLAPFRFLPHEGDLELTWTAVQQMVGSTYVIVGLLALTAARVATGPADRTAVGAPAT